MSRLLGTFLTKANGFRLEPARSCLLFALGLWFAPGLWCANAPLTGFIHGVLHAEGGAPISGARVTAHSAIPANRVNVNLSATGPTVASAVTAADGSFALQALPAGTYTLCAQAEAAAQINPCHWSQTPPKVTLTAGQQVANYNFTLVKGQELQIRLDDPSALIGSAPRPLGRPHVLIGVITSRGQFYPVSLASKDSTGRNHSLVVPANTTLRLSVTSRALKLTDSAGTALETTGHVVPFRIDSAVKMPQPYLFHVVGKN